MSFFSILFLFLIQNSFFNLFVCMLSSEFYAWFQQTSWLNDFNFAKENIESLLTKLVCNFHCSCLLTRTRQMTTLFGIQLVGYNKEQKLNNWMFNTFTKHSIPKSFFFLTYNTEISFFSHKAVNFPAGLLEETRCTDIKSDIILQKI